MAFSLGFEEDKHDLHGKSFFVPGKQTKQASKQRKIQLKIKAITAVRP